MHLTNQQHNCQSLIGWILIAFGVFIFCANPAAGLELMDALTSERSLQNYHLLPSVRGDLLKKLGRSTKPGQNSHARRRLLRMLGNGSCFLNARKPA